VDPAAPGSVWLALEETSVWSCVSMASDLSLGVDAVFNCVCVGLSRLRYSAKPHPRKGWRLLNVTNLSLPYHEPLSGYW